MNQRSHSYKRPRVQSVWPYCFADAHKGHLTKRQWWAVIAGFILLHLLALQASLAVGCFYPDPNHDHIKGMHLVLERGYLDPMRVPPGFSYYLAFKWSVTKALGLPYWSGKYFIDIFFVVLSGVLTILLTAALTKNRFFAIVSGFVLICAPIYILGVAMEEASIFFLPFFLISLLLLVKELQREKGPRHSIFFAAGAIMGLACLIRANPQFIFVVIGPFVFWVLSRSSIKRWRLRAFTVLSAFLLAQALVVLPSSLAKARANSDGVTDYPIRCYFCSIRLLKGTRIGDWMGKHYEEPERSLKGLVGFNLTWLRKDPFAIFELYLVKFIKAWYISESGRWDRYILIMHLPFWLFALLGLWRWHKRAPGDAAYLFILGIIIYIWAVTAMVGGVARQTCFIYGFIGILDGVGTAPLFFPISQRK